MSYKKRLISAISVSILALSGCDNNADNDNPNDRPNENDECIITGPVCHGNATQVCQNGKLAETPCPADTTCTHGICEPNTPVTCENVTEPTCHGSIRVYCESQTLKYDTCPAGVCENGRCVECKSDYKACLDTGLFDVLSDNNIAVYDFDHYTIGLIGVWDLVLRIQIFQ